MRIGLAGLIGLALAGCATTRTAAPVTVKIIAFNDFHGNLEPPLKSVEAPAGSGKVQVPAGGVAYLASAVASLRAANPNTIVVSAGDMISASPLASALFLDEPTIAAMNLIGVDLNAVGNHEFDRGRQELLRMQQGGCAKFTLREPCALDPFAGATFTYLAANVLTESGAPLFPATAIRSFGTGKRAVKIGFIGMTLKGTSTMVMPTGIEGLRFADEADTANAQVAALRAGGADAIVVLIHQGAYTEVGYNDHSCGGISGDVLPVLARLDSAIDLVVSGHTHRAYVCDYGAIDAARPFLLTSAGLAGTLLTDITLSFDARTHKLVGKRADNVIVQGEGYATSRETVPVTDLYPRFAADPKVAALVARYKAAAAERAARPIGTLAATADREINDNQEQVLGDLIADAQLAAMRAPERGSAQIALMNRDGNRVELVPGEGGAITFGQLFATQPFGNLIVTRSYTGRQLRAVLEQQFARPGKPQVLLPSANFRYSFDLSRAEGQRILDPRIDGQPMADDIVYRVALSNFLAQGGDGFPTLAVGANEVVGPLDIEALEAYFAASPGLAPPATDRIRNVTPKP
jgi:5'-nucleotidase